MGSDRLKPKSAYRHCEHGDDNHGRDQQVDRVGCALIHALPSIVSSRPAIRPSYCTAARNAAIAAFGVLAVLLALDAHAQASVGIYGSWTNPDVDIFFSPSPISREIEWERIIKGSSGEEESKAASMKLLEIVSGGSVTYATYDANVSNNMIFYSLRYWYKVDSSLDQIFEKFKETFACFDVAFYKIDFFDPNSYRAFGNIAVWKNDVGRRIAIPSLNLNNRTLAESLRLALIDRDSSNLSSDFNVLSWRMPNVFQSDFSRYINKSIAETYADFAKVFIDAKPRPVAFQQSLPGNIRLISSSLKSASSVDRCGYGCSSADYRNRYRRNPILCLIALVAAVIGWPSLVAYVYSKRIRPWLFIVGYAGAAGGTGALIALWFMP